MKILLIDDDRDLCQLTQKVLTKQGYLVYAFYDAPTAIKHARISKPDLILMDIMLPGLSGPEVVSALKTEPQFREVPVIFLSALVSGEEIAPEDEWILVGGVRYPTLGKPYEIDSLLSIVKRYDK